MVYSFKTGYKTYNSDEKNWNNSIIKGVNIKQNLYF